MGQMKTKTLGGSARDGVGGRGNEIGTEVGMGSEWDSGTGDERGMGKGSETVATE
jgi:hypothetical protein